MSKSSKRLRQTSIFESFHNSKREKLSLDSMEDNLRKVQEDSVEKIVDSIDSGVDLNVIASAEEKRIAHCISNTLTSEDELCDGLINETSSLNIVHNILDSQLSQSSNSDDLFPRSNSSSKESSELNEVDSCSLKKTTLLNRCPECCLVMPLLTPSTDHTVMFRPHLRDGDAPRPYPDEYRDKWDPSHVRMPCSPENRYPVENPSGEKVIQSRWELIRRSLTKNITSSLDLENAILQYNSQYSGRWDFRGLHAFFNKSLKPAERENFFASTLPAMVRLTLQLPQICTQPIPLLKKWRDHSITFSQKQIGCLLLNAFFCTFPRRNFLPRRHSSQRWNSEYASYPDINFNRLFVGTKNEISSKNSEKLKCLLNYFSRITSKDPSGTVTFHRQYLQQFPNWAASKESIKSLVVRSDGLIETEGHGMLQVDFANRFVGGGVLSQGCVQEEIRFIICPELIVSRLFTECLINTEALIITGVEQYNKYSGYAETFLWNGDFQDTTPRDAWGRKYTQVVAIDALHFRDSDEQFKLSLIKRELNKAFSGYFENNTNPENLSSVATGNWGCGVFNGNPNLKFLIQLMAASQAGRDVLYFTFGSNKLQDDIENIHKFITEKKLTVGNIWSLLEDYCTDIMQELKEHRPNLYDYIYCVHSAIDEDSEFSQVLDKSASDKSSCEHKTSENSKEPG